MPSSQGNMTWRQWSIILSMVALLLVGFGVFNTKADKKSVEEVENRCIARITEIKDDMTRQFGKLEAKQDKIYDLLMRMNNISKRSAR